MEIFKWSQSSVGDSRSKTYELNKTNPNSSSVRATAGTMKSDSNESPSSVAKEATLNRNKFVVSPSLTIPFLDLAKADEGNERMKVIKEPLSSFSNSWARKGMIFNSTPCTSNLVPVDGCSKRDRTKDTGSSEVTVIKKQKYFKRQKCL